MENRDPHGGINFIPKILIEQTKKRSDNVLWEIDLTFVVLFLV
jgi:hypothetical protein